MVAWRYEISLLVLKKIFHEWAQRTSEIFFNSWREISYLRAAIYPLFIIIFIINEIILISSPSPSLSSSQPTSKVTFSYSLMITRLPCLETDKGRHTNDENILTFWLAVCLSVTCVPVVTRTIIRAINIWTRREALKAVMWSLYALIKI